MPLAFCDSRAIFFVFYTLALNTVKNSQSWRVFFGILPKVGLTVVSLLRDPHDALFVRQSVDCF